MISSGKEGHIPHTFFDYQLIQECCVLPKVRCCQVWVTGGGEGCGGAKPGVAAGPPGAASGRRARTQPSPAGRLAPRAAELPLPALTLSGGAPQSTAIICFKECIFGTQCTMCCCCPRDNSIISSFASSVIVPVSKEQAERIYSSGVG